MKVLVLAPHPDDEALGCGGAIRQHADAGDTVHVVYLTDGELGAPGEDPAATAIQRKLDAARSCFELGVAHYSSLGYPDGGLEQVDFLDRHIRDLISVAEPDLIYAPHAAESHPDHAATGIAAITAVRGYYPVVAIRLYEVWTPLQKVDLCLDITAQAGIKRSAIRCHRTQLWSGFDTAILALNQYRGLMHGPGMLYAEAFGVL